MGEDGHQRDPVAFGVFYALFKVTSVADLSGPEKAVEWAQSALDDEKLLEAFAESTRKAREARDAQSRDGG